VFTAHEFYLSRESIFRFLEEMERGRDIIGSCYIPGGRSQAEIEELLKKEISLPAIAGLPDLITTSKTGAALFWRSARVVLMLPPFPLAGSYRGQGCLAEPLRVLLGKDYAIALVLLRLGAYAVGVCRGETLVTSKVGTGLVHQRHRQGGSSSSRFRRHREKQIETFLTRVCAHIREHVEAYAKGIDYIVYGGSRTALLLLEKRCPFLEQFSNRALSPLLDIAEPCQPVLEKAVKRIWTTKVIEWQEM
jgi:hypothetical protein